jgi:hypothetical protein
MKKTNEHSAGGEVKDPWVADYEQAEAEVVRERQKKALAAGKKRRQANVAKRKRAQIEFAEIFNIKPATVDKVFFL